MTTSKKETWQDVYKAYWPKFPMSDDDLTNWRKELPGRFADLKRGALSEALRGLGASGDFRRYPPRLPDVMKAISDIRKDAAEALRKEAAGKHGKTVQCPFCADSGWLLWPQVRYTEDGLHKIRLPQHTMEKIAFDSRTCMVCTHETTDTKMSIPCFCESGAPYSPDHDPVNLKRVQARLREWMETLPLESQYKPVALALAQGNEETRKA